MAHSFFFLPRERLKRLQVPLYSRTISKVIWEQTRKLLPRKWSDFDMANGRDSSRERNDEKGDRISRSADRLCRHPTCRTVQLESPKRMCEAETHHTPPDCTNRGDASFHNGYRWACAVGNGSQTLRERQKRLQVPLYSRGASKVTWEQTSKTASNKTE